MVGHLQSMSILEHSFETKISPTVTMTEKEKIGRTNFCFSTRFTLDTDSSHLVDKSQNFLEDLQEDRERYFKHISIL